MDKITSLSELTGQESGIIVWENKSVGVFNWSCCPEFKLPHIFHGIGTVYLQESEDIFDCIDESQTDDVLGALPGTIWEDPYDNDPDGDERILDTDMDIAFDENQCLAELYMDMKNGLLTSGSVYYLPNKGITVIAPDGWA